MYQYLGSQDHFLDNTVYCIFFCRVLKLERTKLSVRVAIVDVDAVVGDFDGVGLLIDAVEGVVAK